MSESHLSDDPSWNARAFSIASQTHKNRNLKNFLQTHYWAILLSLPRNCSKTAIPLYQKFGSETSRSTISPIFTGDKLLPEDRTCFSFGPKVSFSFKYWSPRRRGDRP